MKGLSRFWKLFLAEVIIVVAVGGYFLIDSHDVYRWWVGDTLLVEAPACDVHQQRCDATLSSGETLSLDIEPKPIPLMKPLRFRVEMRSLTLPSIELKIFATNMNMGFHTFTLQAKGEGIYEGEGMLPTCVVGNMIWQTNVIINKPNQSIGATFYFQTDK